MKISIVQMVLSDVLEENMDRIEGYTDEAKLKDVDAVCFPECALTGYYNNFDQINEKQLECNYSRLSQISEQTGIHLIIGSPFYKDQRRYNSALFFAPDKRFQYYHKKTLTNYDSLFFTPGHASEIFEINGYKWGVVVCRDQNCSALFSEYKKKSAKGVFILSAHYYPENEARQKKAKNKAIPIVRALDNHLVVCKSNAVGVNKEMVSLGGSIIVSEKGYIMAEADEENEAMLVLDLNST